MDAERNDDKLLQDLMMGLAYLDEAFRKNNLEPPKAIAVPHDTYTQLKMMRPSHVVHDPKAGWRVQIRGVMFEEARS